MPSLRDDVFLRRGPGARPGPGPVLGSDFFVLVFVSLALLTLSRLRSDIVTSIEAAVTTRTLPVAAWIGSALEPVRTTALQLARVHELETEARQLRAENDQLRLEAWRTRELEHKVAELERLQRVVADPGTTVVVARVVLPGNGPFTRAALMNAGRRHGLRNGLAVVTARGLVGRIVVTTETAARVLLLTDDASRIPVLVGRSGTRAILTGDGSARPRLALLAAPLALASGDEIVTAGTGGLMPRGVRIGTLVMADGEARAELHVDSSRIDYVSVLVNDAPALDLFEEDAGASRAPRFARRDGRDPGDR